ncbi:response regulator transcription factor [Solimonas flava]|uniref:response regulator transcription factor n=1 Tax=Solimonas flava TaxID=415849 RepID=UPI0005B85381|nr:response regulator transcription factor [Solimonas flava]
MGVAPIGLNGLRSTAKILLIDDDAKLCRLLAGHLEPLGYAVTTVSDGWLGIGRVSAEPWDLVILDIMLPRMDGFEVLKRIRAQSSVPVLMLTARGDEFDRIVGLEIGADDYVPKTFSSRELLARIKALLRRAQSSISHDGWQADGSLVAGELRLQPHSHEAFVGGTTVPLTPVEFGILLCLARTRGAVKPREELIDDVRALGRFQLHDRSLDVHISTLRKKLGDHAEEPRFIRTVRGIGYMLVASQRPLS